MKLNPPFLWVGAAGLVGTTITAAYLRKQSGIAPEKEVSQLEAMFALVSPKFDGVNPVAVASIVFVLASAYGAFGGGK